MIKNIKFSSTELNVKFINNFEDNYPIIWLRDHAKDENNWDDRSSQRKTFTAGLDESLHIKKTSIVENGKYLDILWSDLERPTRYSYEFLFGNSLKKENKNRNIKTWKNNDTTKDVYIDYDITTSKEGFKKFLQKLYNWGFCVITNCKTEMKSVETIANKIGYVRQSIFGGLWSFQSDENMADSAYTQEELRPHTDATYSNDAPGLQLLLCCEYNAKGGESIMVDGFKIAETIKKENKEIYEILSNVEVPGNYIGDGVFLEARRPIFKMNSDNELIQVSFNNYDRADFRLKNDLMIKFYKAIKRFDLIANSKDFQWRHILKPGELLIFNNWRILHGRGEFKGIRKMSGCYINKEDFDSVCKLNKIY